MNRIHTKNKLYILPALLFCICLQATEIAQPNTEQTITQSLPNSNFTHNQNSRYIRPKPKPNNTILQDATWSPNMTEPQNTPTTYNMTESYNTNYATQQNNPGFFDSHFGAGQGYVINSIGPNTVPRAVAIQEDNKIVIAGIRDNRAVLIRHNDNGELDRDFGNAGTVIQHIGGISYFNAVAIQEECSQRIIAVGSSEGKGVLIRYYDNGTIDTQFGTRGFIRTDIIGELNAVTVQKDKKIVVAGYNTHNIADTQIVLIRYDEDGLLDKDFGSQGTGIVFTRVGRLARANAIAIQENDHNENNDKIVVVGTIDTGNRNDMVVARYNKNGTIDHSFGLNNFGSVTIQTGKNNSVAYDVAIQKDGKIIVVGSSISPFDKSLFTIVRLNEDGSRDTSFGTNGIVAIAPPIGFPNDNNAYARSVALDENEKIIVMGYIMEGNYNYFSLIGLNHDGTLDTTFGYQGFQNRILKLNPTSLNRAEIPVVGAIQNNKKKLVLAGMYSDKYSRTASLMAVARYHN